MASTKDNKGAAASARGRVARGKGASNGKAKRAPKPRAKSAGAAGSNGAKRSLQVLSEERVQVPCLTCALCCTYIALEIDAPDTAKGASEVLWYLYHDRVTVYYDPDEGDDGWHVQPRGAVPGFQSFAQIANFGIHIHCEIG